MSSNYYLYNPADNLALAQAILLANSDNGMSYVIPYEEKGNGTPAQPLGAILYAIERFDLQAGGQITNRSGADLNKILTPGFVDHVKEMVKRSVQQAPPTGWQEADVDDPASQFTVLSVRGTPNLSTSLFENGIWRDADTSQTPRGNPNVAYGGTITDAVFVDFAGHFNQTPRVIGEQRISRGGKINSGTLYEHSPGDLPVAEDYGNPYSGLAIDATGKDVTLVNFSVTSQGFGRERGALDDLAFRSFAAGVPLQVRNGDVTLSGDVVIDQVTQVVSGAALFDGAIDVSGSDAKATFDNAHIYLGAVRGYESLIHADNDASLQFTDSTVYGFASSNSTAPNLPSPGLLWADFESKDAVGIQHLVSVDQGASLGFSNTTLLREEPWSPQGAEEQILNAKGKIGNWDGNDYDNISEGEIAVGSGSDLTIEDSTILGSIVVRASAGNVSVKDSQIAGKPVGDLSGSLVQLDGGNITIDNTLIDSLDVNGGAGGNGTLALGSDVHVLSTNTPDGVPVTTRSDYTGLGSFAAPSQSTQLSAWADKDTSAANPSGGSREPAKVNFQFFGPQSTSKTAANLSRELTSFISEPSPPTVDASGARIHTVRLSFSEPVIGLDRSDLEQALGSAARADGWQVTAAPLSRDGGSTWTATIQAPATSGSNQPIQLLAGAASSTFSSTLPSLASNTLTLQSAQAGGAPGGGSGTGPHITSVVASFGSLLDASEQANPQTITVFTEDVLNGSTLELSLNGTTYTSQAVNNQASFVLPPADLALLPAGIDQLQVTGTSNGVTIPAATQSFSVDGAAPAAIPHITSVAPSFGASLDRSELAAAQTLAVTTTGIEAGQVLTLQIDGKSAPAAVSGGSVDAAGTASFNLPVSVLSSLKPGLHQFSVSGSNQSGTAAPPAALSFSAEGPQSVTPHVLSIVPAFGGSLSATEAATDQTVQISTEGLPDGAPINLLLFGKTYTATITSNAASFTLPSADLQALPVGTDLLSITQPSSTTTVPLPSAQQSFTVEGSTPVPPPHILSITPAFGVLLDPSEAASDQTVEVRTDSFASSGSSLSLGLNGVTYTPSSVAGDRATFLIPTTDLTGLATGVQSLQANGSSGGVTAPELTLAFTVGAATSTPAHITGIAPSFGSLLDATEAASNQTVVVSTDGIADATTLLLLLNGNRLSADVSGSKANFTLSSGLLSALNPGLQTIDVIESGNTAVSSQFTFSVESPTPVVSPHVISIVPSFGGVLSAREAQVNQTILVGTEGVEDGQPVTLSGAGLNLTETVNGGQASFTLTPAQLGALPQGLDTIQVKVSNAAGVAAPTGTQSFAVEGQSFIPSPHFTSIAASFGSLLDATEVSNAQSVVVTTEGVPDSTALTLDINSTVTYTASVSGNTATFLIPAGDLSGLNAGVDLLQVSGTTTTGTTIPSMSQAFSVDGPAPSNTPHFTSIDPTFGAVLDSSEAATNQTIGVISTGLTDGQVLQMQLNGIQYTASVSSNNASFTIPAAELQALPRGTDTLLVNAPGTATPQGSQSFTVTAPSSGGGSTGCCCTTTGGDDLLIKGGSGADTLTGGSGDDTISGGQGDDIIRGCSGDDTLSGGKGQDTLRGSSGDDLLKGHTFHDTLHGGSGDDTLIGGKGQDILIGGKGSDTFQLSKGNDTIRDFSITNGDVIDAPNNLNLQLIQRDDHLLLKDSDHNIKTRLLNINRDDLLSYQPELLG